MKSTGSLASAAVAATLLTGHSDLLAGRQAPALPALLGEYVTAHARLTAAERTALTRGEPVTKVLDATSSEVAVFGAVRINAPMARYVAAAKDIERFESGGGIRVTKRISSPPQLEDFAQFRLSPDDLAALKTCNVGDCELKISEETITRFRREVDWSRPTAAADAEALARRVALNYVRGYLEGGNERLAVYRDASRPRFVGREFVSMIERLPALTSYLPDLKRYLLDFPKASLPNSTSFLYWQEAEFGLKPTVRISHFTMVEQPSQVVIASKMLYASHYFWTALELRVLLPDTNGAGFWFVSVNRARSDGLSGFVGSIIRGTVRGEAEKGMKTVLDITKKTLERP